MPQGIEGHKFRKILSKFSVVWNNWTLIRDLKQNRTAGRRQHDEKMSPKTGNAQSRATFFRHSAGLLRKVSITTDGNNQISIHSIVFLSFNEGLLSSACTCAFWRSRKIKLKDVFFKKYVVIIFKFREKGCKWVSHRCLSHKVHVNFLTWFRFLALWWL